MTAAPTLRDHVRLHDRKRRALLAAAAEMRDLLREAVGCPDLHPERSCADKPRCEWMGPARRLLAKLEETP